VDATLQDPLVGRLVDGRYHVESRIAGGGMATVYLALDRRLDRDVALKVMHQELTGDDDFVSRFIREARAAARLSHPNVVQVYDQGEDDGLLYLAMEYLPGRTLRESLTERGALTIREALRVLEPVLDALAAAHRAGIVHGDVKPENVVLTDDGRAKVADFGLARAGAATLTSAASERLLGTAAYLAPELLTRGIADARADVYAVGILLYEMLTGRQPFTGDDALQVARRHVVEAVPPPSMLVGHVPVELDDLVTAATATDPDQRPANAEQMLAMARAARQVVPEAVLDLRPAVPRSTPESLTQVVPREAVRYDTRALVVTHPQTVVGYAGEADQDQLLPSPPRWRWGIGLVVALAVLALAGAAWWFVVGPGGFTTIPSVSGQTLTAAGNTLSQAGLHPATTQVYDDTIPAGQVVGTQPPSGRRVHRGSTVTIRLSLGPQLFEVPALVGKKEADARKLIARANLTYHGHTAYNDTVDAGKVTQVDPPAGTRLRRGQAVDVTISKGPPPIEVPNLRGLSRGQAEGRLDELGLRSETRLDVSEQVAAGLVIDQDPTPGKTLTRGETVTLVVSSGPPLVQVPDVTDQRVDQAMQTLQAAGFRVTVRGPRIIDRVQRQVPAAGSMQPKGSVVTLFVV
jgi:beta-lactam-binding protein with PASTA domain/predicted Ser/Thr protein kinase